MSFLSEMNVQDMLNKKYDIPFMDWQGGLPRPDEFGDYTFNQNDGFPIIVNELFVLRTLTMPRSYALYRVTQIRHWREEIVARRVEEMTSMAGLAIGYNDSIRYNRPVWLININPDNVTARGIDEETGEILTVFISKLDGIC